MYREAAVGDYLPMARTLGVHRAVIVQPSGYGFDNACTLDALDKMGAGVRAIVVIPTHTDPSELERLNGLGVRGVRFMLLRPGGLGWDDLPAMAEAVAAHDWTLNLQFDGHELPQRLDMLRALPAHVVIDHVGAFVGGAQIASEGFKALCRLLDGGNAWVKLSGPYTYRMSAVGGPDYPEVASLVQHLARHYPDRCLWATDWPHVSEPSMLPDYSLAARFFDWIGDEKRWCSILVDNPARLYGFGPDDALTNGPR
jgi:D-galactarolactone isomerase